MGKRKNIVHRTAQANAFTDDLKPGDVITGEDMLGIDSRMTEQLPPSGWLRGDASPFKMDVFDCRANALTMVSTTSDSGIAETFSRLRRSDGREYIDTFPEDARGVEVQLRFELDGHELKDGPLFKAEQMEDKWDIYLYGHVMYFVRSWSGTLAHAALCREIDGVLSVEVLVTAVALVDEREPSFFVREIFYLIVSHVLGDVYPHPIPSYHADSDESILMFSFSEYGRRGWYGTLAGMASAGTMSP